jgi:peptidoglycan DL-endopeptidase CwlO
LRRTVTACLAIMVASGLAHPNAIQPAIATTPTAGTSHRTPGIRHTPAPMSPPSTRVAPSPPLASGYGAIIASTWLNLAPGYGTASRTDRLREEAAEVRATIERFNEDIDDLVEDYNANDEALGQTRAAMRQTATRLDTAQDQLDDAKQQLRRRARAVYIWERDPFSKYGQLLSVRGLHDVAAAHGYQSWVMGADERAVARVTHARRSLEALSQWQADQHQRQLDLVKRLQGKREAIERELHEQQRYLEQLTDQIRQAVEREQRDDERRRHHAMLRQLTEERREREREYRRHARKEPRERRRERSVPGGGIGRLAVRWALRQVGKPYRWGASGPGAFDCSGLTMRAYATAGVRLPRTSRAQFQSGRRLGALGQMRPGDLLFFGRSGRSINHVGMYIGNGQMVHSPNSGSTVRVASIARRNFVGAARPGG